jgi:hypothetical protein
MSTNVHHLRILLHRFGVSYLESDIISQSHNVYVPVDVLCKVVLEINDPDVTNNLNKWLLERV